jgi:hypothetical protein
MDNIAHPSQIGGTTVWGRWNYLGLDMDTLLRGIILIIPDSWSSVKKFLTQSYIFKLRNRTSQIINSFQADEILAKDRLIKDNLREKREGCKLWPVNSFDFFWPYGESRKRQYCSSCSLAPELSFINQIGRGTKRLRPFRKGTYNSA